MFFKRKVVHGCQVYLDGLGMFSNVKELIIHTQWNSFVENKSKKVFTEIVRQFYANPGTNSRINEKVFEVSSMVNAYNSHLERCCPLPNAPSSWGRYI